MKPHWEISQKEVDDCLAATEWCPAIHEYFRGGGYSSRFLTEGGVLRVTLPPLDGMILV